jgi:restriction system protein
LLEAMGYEQVEVTKASGDKGVDVVGKVQVGITTITEVVQVKRMQNTITRPFIDQLRGSTALPQSHSARLSPLEICGEMRRSGVIPRSSPITLIDGDRLLELIENNVGIRRSNAVELLDGIYSCLMSWKLSHKHEKSRPVRSRPLLPITQTSSLSTNYSSLIL